MSVESFDPSNELNIFTINNPSSSGSSVGSAAAQLQKFLAKIARPPMRTRKLKDRWRRMFDPAFAQQRREVRKWRQWHEVFCSLNEIEQELVGVLGLLVQAAGSMRRFGDCHAVLGGGSPGGGARLSAFLGDAALYFRSEAEVPQRLEDHLGKLERIADEFRSISMEVPWTEPELNVLGSEDEERHLELQRTCEDLQVDIAVLLESAIMAAQQALAEYKKMHCRLELLAIEYEPICRLELETVGPVLLPLIADEDSTQVSVGSIPDRAVQWALDFSQLVGSSSQGLEVLVRELEQRVRQLRALASNLRSLTLQRASQRQMES